MRHNCLHTHTQPRRTHIHTFKSNLVKCDSCHLSVEFRVSQRTRNICNCAKLRAVITTHTYQTYKQAVRVSTVGQLMRELKNLKLTKKMVKV